MKKQSGQVHVAIKDHKEEQYSERVNTLQEGGGKEKDVQSSENHPCYLESRCCVRKFADLVSTFDEEKVEAVKQLGLEGLLKIQSQNLKNKLIADLAHKFDVEHCQLYVHGERLNLTVKHIQKTLGLPSEGDDVESFLGPLNDDILKEVNLPQNMVSLSKLYKEIQTIPSGTEFQAKFFLYALGTIIAPSSTTYINRKYFGLLNDMIKIQTMNWAKYTLENLRQGILNFKGSTSGTKGRINGCILMLQIFYLEHTCVGYQTLSISKPEIPSIQYWGSDAVQKVFNKILRLGGIESEKVKLLYANDNDMEPLKIKDVLNEIQDLRKEMSDAKKDTKVDLESYNLSTNIGNSHNILCEVKNLKNEFDVHRREMIEFKSSVLMKLDQIGASNSNPTAIQYFGKELADLKVMFKGMFNKEGDLQDPKESVAQVEKNTQKKTCKGLGANRKIAVHKTRKRKQHMTHRTKIHRSDIGVDVASKTILNAHALDQTRFSSRKDKAIVVEDDSSSGGSNSDDMEDDSDYPMVTDKILTQKDLNDPINDICDLILKQGIQGCDKPCDYGNAYVYMSDLLSLQPKRWIDSSLFDVMAIALMLEEKEKKREGGWIRWYMPALFQYYVLKEPDTPVKTYLGLFKEYEIFMTCPTLEQIFVPINDNNEHWYLLVIHLKKKTGFLYDTLRIKDMSARERDARKLLESLHHLFHLPEFYVGSFGEHPRLSDYPIVNVNTFQQPNTFDCGVYVLEYMRHASLEVPFVEKDKDSNTMRREILAYLLFNESHKQQQRVLSLLIKGYFTPEEDKLMIDLHSLIGNKWSLIADRLHGRTGNEIMKYWNTHIKPKLLDLGFDPQTHRPLHGKTPNQPRSGITLLNLEKASAEYVPLADMLNLDIDFKYPR